MPKSILVTGAAGFIGFHTALALHKRGDHVIGLDNFNAYYDPALKEQRAAILQKAGIEIVRGDITDKQKLGNLFELHAFSHVLHLAAQAGVRHARKQPESYLTSNLEGFLVLLEVLKQYPHIALIYASSSSVYGVNDTVPFSITDRTDRPANLYAATKKANELMAYAYHHMYDLSMTGLRYFTVYGPWGRPDMAYFSFTKAIDEGSPITLYNQGQMWRDFTYIDDIVAGTLSAIDHMMGYQVFNLGNHQSESLMHFVHILEQLMGKQARIVLADCPSDEMIKTYANIDTAQQLLGFTPKISLKEGLSRFVDWYQEQMSLKAAGKA